MALQNLYGFSQEWERTEFAKNLLASSPFKKPLNWTISLDSTFKSFLETSHQEPLPIIITGKGKGTAINGFYNEQEGFSQTTALSQTVFPLGSSGALSNRASRGHQRPERLTPHHHINVGRENLRRQMEA
jgi:hypothetical protein